MRHGNAALRYRCAPVRHRLSMPNALVPVLCCLPMVLLLGCEHRQIIRPTPQMDADSQFWIRVLLLANASECTVEIPSPFHIVQADLGPGIKPGSPPRKPLGGPTRLSMVRGQLMLGTTPIPNREVVIQPESPFVLGLNGRNYRGSLKLIVKGDGQVFDVLNLVPLEPYLAGVVGEEMPDYWEPQALRAQAIAARTYCLYIKNRFGPNRSYDVSRTQASQVYGGVASESSQVWKAVNGTVGKVLVENRTRAGRDSASPLLARGLFPAYFSSVCGGHTSNSQDVFGDSFGPLAGAPCPYCKDVARLDLFLWPMAQFSRKTVTEQLVARYPRLKTLGEVKEIVVADKTDYGQFARLTKIRLVGTTGQTETLRAEDLRLAIDSSGRRLKSTICQIVRWGDGWAFLSGRGWGHGVGMCQCGAEGMARQGHSAEQILQHYYPGAKIVSVY
ncbi:MAG: SpoIID/LytB domain-containing protein [Phycisphaerae bacterium]|nr:SpoIID/LytB domain-containing protein [Phycisphaerae bacterium]